MVFPKKITKHLLSWDSVLIYEQNLSVCSIQASFLFSTVFDEIVGYREIF